MATFELSPVKCAHALCIIKWWCLISDTRSCRAVTDKILVCYELSMISMLNKQDKNITFVIVYSLPNSWVWLSWFMLCLVKHRGTIPATTNTKTLTKASFVQAEGDIWVEQTWALTFTGAWGDIESSQEMHGFQRRELRCKVNINRSWCKSAFMVILHHKVQMQNRATIRSWGNKYVTLVWFK